MKNLDKIHLCKPLIGVTSYGAVGHVPLGACANFAIFIYILYFQWAVVDW